MLRKSSVSDYQASGQAQADGAQGLDLFSASSCIFWANLPKNQVSKLELTANRVDLKQGRAAAECVLIEPDQLITPGCDPALV